MRRVKERGSRPNARAASEAKLLLPQWSEPLREDFSQWSVEHVLPDFARREAVNLAVVDAQGNRHLLEIEGGPVPDQVVAASAQLLFHVLSTKRPPALRPRDSAERALELLGKLIPRRLADEEIGDALEQLTMMRRDGAPRWHVVALVITRAVLVSWRAISWARGRAKKTKR